MADYIQKYVEQAKSKARLRKNPWNFLFFASVPVFVALWYCLLVLAIWNQFAPDMDNINSLSKLSQIIFMLPPTIPAIPLGMVTGNVLVYLIPWARVAINHEEAASGRPGFRRSTVSLLILAALSLFITIPISIFGVCDCC
jgi:hypothetical protein